tara:strand:+ start:66 stop:317 length:252 start_codon:yes stop_codon:yes gene_type:complete
MHSEYLRKLFLGNDLAEGQFEVDGAAVALNHIRTDIFCVAPIRAAQADTFAAVTEAQEMRITASDWFDRHQPKDGSWWQHWVK